MKKLNLIIVLILGSICCKAQTPPSLGNSLDYGLLSGDSITLNDTTLVSGKAGALHTISGIIRASSGIYANGSGNVSSTLADVAAAMSYCSGLTGGAITGQTLTAGVYQVSSNLDLYGSLNLEGDTTSVFIFNIPDSLICRNGFSLNLIGVTPVNIFFNVGKSFISYADVNLSGVIFAAEASLIGNNFIGQHALFCLEEITSNSRTQFFSGDELSRLPFSLVYFGSGCGLKYFQSSTPLNYDRHVGNTQQGSLQPYSFNVTVPAGSNILAAYLFFNLVDLGSPPTTVSNITIIDPQGSPPWTYNNVPRVKLDNMQSIGWFDPPGGWNYTQTGSYRALVTSAFTNFNGPGLYTLDGIPSLQNIPGCTSDPNGATLFVIYTDLNTLPVNNGTLLLYSGLSVNQSGVIFPFIISNAGFAAPASVIPTQSSAFMVSADFQNSFLPTDYDLWINNFPTGVTVPPRMWQFIERKPTFFTLGQSSMLFAHRNGPNSDCNAIIALGGYYQNPTSACNSCGLAGCDQYVCVEPGSSVTVQLNAANGSSWQWSGPGLSATNIQNPSATISVTSTYTVTVTPGGTGTMTVFINNSPSPPVVIGSTDGCINGGLFYVDPVDPTLSYSYVSTIGGQTISGIGDHPPQFPNPQLGGCITFYATTSLGCQSQTTLCIDPCCPDLFQIHNVLLSELVTNEPAAWVLFYPNYTAGSPPLPNGSGYYVMDASVIAGGVPVRFPSTFEVNANLEIRNTTGYLMYNSVIDVDPHMTLILNHSTITNCTWMWNRIHLKPDVANGGGTLLSQNSSIIRGGINAVYAEGGSTFRISDTRFEDDYVGIYAEKADFSGSSVRSTQFTTTGNLAFPHLGERTYKDIDLYKVSKITIGDGIQQSYQNLFENSGYGIYGIESEATILNNYFRNITLDQVQPGGWAMYFDGNNNLLQLQIGNILNTYDPNTVERCSHGVFATNKMNLNLIKNSFQDINNTLLPTTASYSCKVTYSKGININILENTFNNFGFLSTVATGAAILIKNVTSSFVAINDNQFNQGSSSYNGNRAIALETVNGTPNITEVSRNIISNARKAINCVNYPQAVIHNINNITLPLPFGINGKVFGIQLNNSSSTTISNNLIQKPGNNPAASLDGRYFGISVENQSENNYIGNNSIYKTGRGIHILNTSVVNTLECNTLFNNYNGVYLDNADIGDQGSLLSNTAQDNNWTHAVPYNKDIKGTNNTFVTKWYSRSINPPWSPSLLDLDPAPSYIFPPNPPLFNTSNPNPNCVFLRCKECEQEKMAAIANGDGDFSLLSEEDQYRARKTVYQQLKEDPSFMDLGTDNDDVLQDYYDNTEQTSLGQLAAVDSLIEQDTSQAAMLTSTISPENHSEENAKAVYQIYLDTYANGIYEFTQEQYNILMEIALENPYNGGTAVYSARVMLEIEIDDDSGSGNRLASQNISHKSLVIGKTPKSKLYPNPAENVAYYLLPLNENETGRVEVYDVFGKQVQHYSLNKLNYIVEINGLNFSSGVYFLKVFINNTFFETKKLVVNK